MVQDRLRLLPDVPWGEGLRIPETAAAQDGLRFHLYADILARAALDTPEPFTIGIYGGWGSGKTSLMRMMRKIVADEPGAVPVWFNAWRYEKEEHLIVPLLATIISDMKENRSKWEAMKEAGEKVMNAFRSVLYGVSVKAKVGIPGLSEAEMSVSPKEMIERYQTASREVATDSLLEQSLYFRAFSELDKTVRQAVGEATPAGPKIVIFVDDLDRCFPDKAVALLEGVKLVLNQPNIAFVLGVAPRVIQAYLKSKYEKDFNVPPELYEDYLEKLVQLSFHVSEISENVEEFARALFKRKEVFGDIDDVFEDEYEPLVAICGPACKDNPRAIVRFLNRLLIMKKVYETKREAKGEGEPEYKISLVHVGITNALDLKWPRVLEACERNRAIPLLKKEGQEPTKRTLCEVLADLLGKHPDEKDSEISSEFDRLARRKDVPEQDAFRILADDASLRKLLESKAGLQWLREPDLRREAKAAAGEVKAEPEPKATPHYEPPWAEDYSQDGWPRYRGYVIRPNARLLAANLQRANLVSANLEGADLERANLQHATLFGAILKYAFLPAANLAAANLERADLEGAKLFGANLERANLEGAKLERAVFKYARYDSETRWPNGFNPDAAGACRMDWESENGHRTGSLADSGE